MCGRFSHRFTWEEIYEHLEDIVYAMSDGVWERTGPPPSYNTAPTQNIPILRREDNALTHAMLQWWLVPHWAKADDRKYATFNARSEDAASKPTFRDAMKHRRCVAPISGFYEWKKVGSAKRPHYIYRADNKPMYIAALWDKWEGAGDRDIPLESCTILTTAANKQMADIHLRMPCILEPETIDRWIDTEQTDPAKLAHLLEPAPEGILAMHEVHKRVGNAKAHNDPALTEPISSEELFS